MAHSKEATIEFNKEESDAMDKIQALWDAKIFVRLEEGNFITVHCNSNDQLNEAKSIIAGVNEDIEEDAGVNEDIEEDEID